MVRVELSHTFPVSVSEAFAYITDTHNWAEYWPGFVWLENAATVTWRQPGDRVIVIIRFLGRKRALHLELQEFETDRQVVYISHQAGLPDAYHERHFQAVPTGCEYRLIVEIQPRPGLLGLFDQYLVKGSIRRSMQTTIHNLERVFQRRQKSTF